ncbi:MAG: sulfatase-like hydrolase/transferase, partial [Pseudomonadota bacterium]
MTDRKNILLISVDDMFAFWRYRDVLGVKLQTPNLDRIIKHSTMFASAYCQAPVCGPSRASAMSGLSPFQTGIFDNYINIFDVLRPEQMWQHRIKRAGYYCSTAGKVHHGYKPLKPDNHDPLYSHPSVHVYFGPKRGAPDKRLGGKTGGSGTTLAKDDTLYYDSRSARNAIRFLQGYSDSDPFYREVGFHHPHLPFQTPIRFKEMYDAAEFAVPDAWLQGFDLAPFAQKYLKENLDPSDTDYWQKTLRNYYSCISHVDEHIGNVWDALQNSDHAKNTIVMIFSDHGYHLGDKNRFRKCTLYEEATRVPLIVHDPDADPAWIDDPVGLIDMGPTLLDYAGCRPMAASPGRSLRPMVLGERDPTRAVPTFWYGNVSARIGAYRITEYQDGSGELHNVETDPWLTKNLGRTHPEYPAIYAKLIDVVAQHGGQMPQGNQMPSGAYAAHTIGAGAGQLGTRGAVSTRALDQTED